ncbi:hypothetical protein F-E9_398 [Faustovirus]|nr:hypothetical protein F-E9_398 [Faustovirus]
MANNDNSITSMGTELATTKQPLFARLFNLSTLRAALGWCAQVSEAVGIIITVITSIDAIMVGRLHIRRVFTLNQYRNYVTSNYKSWLTIYGAWGCGFVFSRAAFWVDRVINRRSWIRRGNGGAPTATVVRVTPTAEFEVVNE